MDQKLEGRVALITGAGSGIGAATARLMSADGASVVLAGIPADGVQAVESEINAAGGSALAIPTDVSSPEQVRSAVHAAVNAFGRLDILVPNAGIQLHNEDREVHSLPEEIWDRTHAVNYRGVFLTCKYGLAQMVEQGEGGVVTIVSSITALSGTTPNVSYSSGKHGLIGLGRNIAVHYARRGIRCNIVCPGALERTPDFDDHPDPSGRAERLRENIPLGRLGTPEDIAPFIAFLATPAASYASGATFVIDGGVTVA